MSYENLHYDDPVNQAAVEAAAAAAMDAATQQQRINQYHDQRNLFVDRAGRSLLFYIPPNEPHRSHYRQLIISYGGVVTDRLVPSSIYLSNNVEEGSGVQLRFIDECINQGRLIKIDQFRYEQVREAEDEAEAESKRFLLKRHNRFTPEKDEFILNQVRMNPRFRHSHRFYQDLAQEDILRGHTGNSVRARFRKHLEPKLGFVYKVDIHDKLVKDDMGRYIELGVDDFPGTLKHKYTAEDDYLLCQAARAYVERAAESLGVPPNFEEAIVLPYSFYDSLYRKRPVHTLHSWRDRFRRYISPGMIPRYIDYFDECVRSGEEPESLLQLNSRAQAKVPSQPGAQEEQEEEVEEEQADSGIASNIDNELMVKQAGSDHFSQPIEVPELVIDVEGGFDEEEEEESQEQEPESQSPIELKYVDESVTFDDLLEGESSEYSDANKMSLLINASLNDVTDILGIFHALRKLGFKDPLISHIIYATSADVSLIPLYAQMFFNSLNNVHLDPNIPMFKVLRIKGNGDIWSEKHDSLLGTKGEKNLQRPHSLDSIMKRKEFLSQFE
ncbi:DNA-binding protein RAP1 [Spathaspora sp. JA1]|nr:DNA-binding protein RAP1 [Spathaspora sp. JA1]